MPSVDILETPSIKFCLENCKTSEEKKRNKSVYSKIIKNFMRNKNVPQWYRELSERQMSYANELLNNLRDDTQQETTHRTKLNLQLLGLCPIPTTQRIKLAMQWSQGNDLAFLWFLLELYYSNNDSLINVDDSYNTNQRIIMSTIAHLDMCPTVRELDRILPKQNKKIKNPKINKQCQTKVEYALPYLEPLKVPVQYVKTKTNVKEPKPRFYPYDMYMDPNYICPNEINRWYADPEQVCSLLSGCDDIGYSKEDRKYLNKEGVSEIMCAQYKDVEEFRKSLTYKLKLAVQKRCERFLENNHRVDEQRDKFIQQLEGDIRNIEDQFDKLSSRFQTQTWLPQLINELLNKTIDLKDVSLCNKILSCAMDPELFGDVIKSGRSKSISYEKSILDYGHNGKIKPNEKYFTAPNSNLPYKFDYSRIFSYRIPEEIESMKKGDCIKNAIEQALDLKKYANEDEAILAGLEDMWSYESQEIRNQKEFCETDTTNEENGNIGESLNQLKESLSNKQVDPKDNFLMNNLLVSAIKELKKDPKFVLVQLPQVHKLELLQFWIRARYGHVVTQKQRENSLSISEKVVEEMRRNKIKIPIPKNSDLTKCKMFSLLHKDYITSKAQILMHSYFEKLKARILEDSQIYWYCMEPTHCKSGPPREVFYSYLPAKPQDILPFRPWEREDFMDAKSAHAKRLKAKSTVQC